MLNGFSFDKDMQIVPIELKFKKHKLVMFSIYRPPNQILSEFLCTLSSSIDFYTRIYDNILVIGDFNSKPQTPVLENFMKTHGLYNHVKTKTCWKFPNGSCIDLMSNKKFPFKNTRAVETHLNDFHLLIHTMLKVNFTKWTRKQYYYRNYRKY